MNTPSAILKNTFGYDTYRPFQREVIENVLAHRDTLAVMPTGGGKSLCYQIPALIFEGLTVVVSPLIALMKDQVEQLRAAGVPALFLNSTLSPEAYAENMEFIRSSAVKLLFVAPETLLTPRIFALLDAVRVDLMTIDEAHCISEWGHDFRPEYRQLADVRRRYPKAVCLALTATATPRVRSDIKASLGFSQSNEFVASFDRDNLYISVTPKEDPFEQTLNLIQRFKDQSGIIYCFSRKQVDDLSERLSARGFSVRPYHAGLPDEDRRRNQEAFIRDDVQIMVATIAFGMGINKPNVRFIVHYDLPKSVEGYYQEIGRAGRDGLPAHCLLLYSYADIAKQRYFINQKKGAERTAAEQQLDAILRYAEDVSHCRRQPLLTYFGEAYNGGNCHNCDNCNGAPPALTDITIVAQKFLSCVKRTGERFGAGYVSDVLRGSKAEKVLSHGHDQLSTYGIGSELSEKQWLNLSRMLMQSGYLNQDSQYHTLSLTGKALTALRQRSVIMGQMPAPERARQTEKTQKVELEYNSALYALLRQQRKALADEAGVPPYVIFSDRTLIEMAAYYPQSIESLLDISGVGQVKARQYGDVFLPLIQAYCQKHHLPEKRKKEKETARPKNDSGRRYMAVGEAYNAGESVSALQERYDVSTATILDHLTRYAAAGNRLRQDDDLASLAPLNAEGRVRVFSAFDELGSALLKPVFTHLDGEVDYDTLKVLRLLYIVSHSN